MPRYRPFRTRTSLACALLAAALGLATPAFGQVDSPAMAHARSVAAQKRWAEAAAEFDRIARGQTSESPAGRQIAAYEVGTCLGRMGLHEAAIKVFTDILASPGHVRAREAAGRLSDELRAVPDGVRAESRLPAPSESVIAALTAPDDRERRAHLSLLLGKKYYREGRHSDALRMFGAVGPGSIWAPRSLLWAAATHVKLGHSVPALKALQSALSELDRGTPGVADTALLYDVARSSLARIYYTSAIRIDPDTDLWSVDEKRLSAAHKYYQRVHSSSPEWPDMAYELGWLYFWAGDGVRSGGFLRALTSSSLPNEHAPSARALRALRALSICRYDEAAAHASKLRAVFGDTRPRLDELVAQTDATGRADAYLGLLLSTRQGRTPTQPDVRAVVERAWADRRIAGEVSWLDRVDGQMSLLAANGAFATTPVGNDARANLSTSRDRIAREVSALVREHVQSERDELVQALEQGAAVEQAIAEGPARDGSDVSVAETRIYGSMAIPMVFWTFQQRLPDDLRRMESGMFYERWVSACGR